MPKSTQKNDTPKQSEVLGLPEDVAAIRAEIRKFFSSKDATGNRIGGYKHGVYAFYDYDGKSVLVEFDKDVALSSNASSFSAGRYAIALESDVASVSRINF